MKKAPIYIITILVLFITSISYAQTPPLHGKMSKERMEKIKILKIGYLTEVLDLSVKEAQQFWPLYNEYEESHLDHRKKEQQFFRKIKEVDTLSTVEAKQLLSNLEKFESENYTNRVLFYKELQKIFSAKKIILFKKAEFDFNKRLLKQFKQRHKKKRK